MERFGEHGEIWRTWRNLENMEKFGEHGECLALYRGETCGALYPKILVHALEYGHHRGATAARSGRRALLLVHV